MIVLEVEQGTVEWHLARCGIPTASMFKSIITPTGKASTSAKTYMNQILADWKAGKPVDPWEGNKFTEIGTERESESRALYELLTDNVVNEVGFCFKDEQRLVGASPDGLVGNEGLVEFKNPKGSTLIGYMLEGKVPSGYIPQVQGQLWVTGRQWCDFMAYHPEIGHVLYRVERDEKFITLIAERLDGFISTMLEKRNQLSPVKKTADEAA